MLTFGKLLCNSSRAGFNLLSASIATTLSALVAILLVKFPCPGPISKTLSPASISANSTICSKSASSFRKCWFSLTIEFLVSSIIFHHHVLIVKCYSCGTCFF